MKKLLALTVASLFCLGVNIPSEEVQEPAIYWQGERIPMRCQDIEHALSVANEILELLKFLQTQHPNALAGHRESVAEYILGYEAVDLRKTMIEMRMWHCTKV